MQRTQELSNAWTVARPRDMLPVLPSASLMRYSRAGDQSMAARTTRTLNPLHFEDLEPHRFEDLVRQLIYDFRHWQSIEATGRLGADEGVDSRASSSPSGLWLACVLC